MDKREWEIRGGRAVTALHVRSQIAATLMASAEERTHVSSHDTGHLKLTSHCVSTIPQLRNCNKSKERKGKRKEKKKMQNTSSGNSSNCIFEKITLRQEN